MTWVVTDYTATSGTNEVSVTKGQQVEIIETACNGSPDFCLVRLNIHSGSAVDGSGTIEGIVPVSVLKFAPSNKSIHRKGGDSSSNDKDANENNGKCLFFWSFAAYLKFPVFSDWPQSNGLNWFGVVVGCRAKKYRYSFTHTQRTEKVGLNLSKNQTISDYKRIFSCTHIFNHNIFTQSSAC